MNTPAPPLSPAAAGLQFHRYPYGGGLEARVTAERAVYSLGERLDITTEDSVTFRVVPAGRFDSDRGQTVRTGWRCIVFANSEAIYDDRGRVCSKLALGKAYLRRLADDPMIQDLAMRALTGEGGPVWKQFDAMHDAFMAAMDDHHGATERS